jgi:hypothetical protein
MNIKELLYLLWKIGIMTSSISILVLLEVLRIEFEAW